MNRNTIYYSGKQNGAVLIASLVILLVLTLVAVSAYQTTNIETKITGNQHSTGIAFQVSESCLALAYSDPATITFSSSPITVSSGDIGSSTSVGSYVARSSFNSVTIPFRGSGYSSIRFQQVHDIVQCVGVRGSDINALDTARVELNQGVSQIIPK